MEYDSEFRGVIKLDKPLDDTLYAFLCKFNETRRMARKVSPEYGEQGEFYVAGSNDWDVKDSNILDYNSPPHTQPGLWCHWRPTKNRMGIEWDGCEKFYEAAEWMRYLVQKILIPAGYTANGKVEVHGEDPDDRWDLIVSKNNVWANQLTSEKSEYVSPWTRPEPLQEKAAAWWETLKDFFSRAWCSFKHEFGTSGMDLVNEVPSTVKLNGSQTKGTLRVYKCPKCGEVQAWFSCPGGTFKVPGAREAARQVGVFI